MKKSIGQRAEFIVTFKPEVVAERHFRTDHVHVAIELRKSGAFSYGNGLSADFFYVDDDGKAVWSEDFDVRYYVGPFQDLCQDILESKYGSNILSIESV